VKAKERWNPNNLMTVVVTMIVLAAAIFIVMSDHYSEDARKWAYGAICTIIGFWLRPNAIRRS